MDVEKLKKINQLSKDLKRHGLVVEEAISQASTILSEKEDEVETFLEKSKEEIESKQNPTSTDQYIVMLERNNRKIVEEVQKVREEMARILSEFEELKNKVAQQARPVIVAAPVSSESERPKETQAQLATPKKKESHPRQGNFTPEDVSIEKMFYYGKK